MRRELIYIQVSYSKTSLVSYSRNTAILLHIKYVIIINLNFEFQNPRNHCVTCFFLLTADRNGNSFPIDFFFIHFVSTRSTVCR